MADFQLQPDISLSNGIVETQAPPPQSSSGAKRQRRPSVRLGEIGSHQPSLQPWRILPHPLRPTSSKIRPLVNSPSAKMKKREEEEYQEGWESPQKESSSSREWRRGKVGGGEDGVRSWLNGLGLGRYSPVFEIHEVDDEVLPLLTLDDLKDMGINAVGSRRKMYCAIQKLRSD